jgi:hypothetical protein
MKWPSLIIEITEYPDKMAFVIIEITEHLDKVVFPIIDPKISSKLTHSMRGHQNKMSLVA